MIIFGLVRFLSKKSNQTDFFLKKPKPVQTDWFRFSFLEKNRFKPVWLGFFFVFSVRFGFRLIKPKRTGRFFQNFNRINRVFLRFDFLDYFFSDFLGLISFSGFFSLIEYIITSIILQVKKIVRS